jgi:mannose-1-phosphate guanylyltransferase
VGRNTAPAIALACFNYDPDDIIFVTPSDHLIRDLDSYNEKINQGVKAAAEGKLITFGIKPEYPETGYGYIEADINNPHDSAIYKVNNFKEKPDLKTAEKYISAGNFYWNSGMFLFKAGVFLEELKKYSSDLYEKSLTAFENSMKDKDGAGGVKVHVTETCMNEIPSDSIDYAVMEKSDNVYVIPSEIGWTDLGSFDSIYDIAEKDEAGNSLDPNLIFLDSKNNLVFSDNRKIALAGIEDLIIIDTDDALLVAGKGCSENIKSVVNRLQRGTASDKELTSVHSTVHRPWGTYTVLEVNSAYKIKKIVVKPGKRLSLQKHLHRSEHWVVVAGTAAVQVGSEEKIVRKNESIYIPIGEIHRLSNGGKIDLAIIETQVGDYLGEDDIIRVEDDFKR